MIKKLLSSLSVGMFSLVILFVLAFSLRGLTGNPSVEELNSTVWQDVGPLELSPERGRFALLYSVLEEKSVIFSVPVARLATPDLGMRNDGKYVSLFAPGVSFLVIPGYLIGKSLGAAQIGAFAAIAMFAFLNSFLIKKILDLLDAHKFVSYLATFSFILASPALAYAVNLYQHHISTFFILLSLYILIKTKNVLWISLIWLLYGLSFIVDYPNSILMFPIAIAGLGRIISPTFADRTISVKITAIGLITFCAGLIPLFFLLSYNKAAYDNPYQLAGTLKSVKELTADGRPTAPKSERVEPLNTTALPPEVNKSATGFFDSRDILRGFIVHFIGLDRGILFFTPVMFLGFVGIVTSYRKQLPYYATMVGLIGVNIILYSMWGDPWGGWAFGSRYLIPSYAILSIFIGLFLSKYRKNLIVVFLFSVLFFYSFAVNLLGAVASSRIPPKVEVLALEELSGQRQRYSYDRDIEFIKGNNSKSALWQSYGHRYLTATEYYWIIFIVVILAVIPFIFLTYKTKK